MANLSEVYSKDLINGILPIYGTPKKKCIPIWDESQKMFIIDEYESASGHRYYRGVRFCDRIVIVEKVGLYHNWTYIDGIEIYAFNGTKLNLVQKRDYDKQFRSEEFVRSESIKMVRAYLEGALKGQGKSMSVEEISEYAKTVVDNSYKSFLDENYNTKLTGSIIPQIEHDIRYRGFDII